MASPRIVVAAGGTGGHLFPAEALAEALRRRGVDVALASDERASRYATSFAAADMHIIPSATVKGRDPLSLARTAVLLGSGLAKAYALLGRLRPAAVIGFGGYPTLPPVGAAILRRIPSLIHDANAVMGRANRLLAPRVDAIATSFPGVGGEDPRLARKVHLTGNPVRPAVLAAAQEPYPALDGLLRLLVFGGSQGARIMADIVPPALEQLEPATRQRFTVVQQAREEDLARVRQTYQRLGVSADVAPFFTDLPRRIAEAHLVVSRSGAGTVAELAVIGRPAILVPLPHALDQDQRANARVLEQAGGAILLPQDAFTPGRLASELAALAQAPDRLAAMAAANRAAGVPNAAERLAELVLQVAGVVTAPA